MADVSTCEGLNSSAQASSDQEPDLTPLIVGPCAGCPLLSLSYISLTGSSTIFYYVLHTFAMLTSCIPHPKAPQLETETDRFHPKREYLYSG